MTSFVAKQLGYCTGQWTRSTRTQRRKKMTEEHVVDERGLEKESWTAGVG